jgi:hypothetical protein
MATMYRDIIPASKTERLQPKFTRGAVANSTTGDLAVKGPRGMPIRETNSGCVYPDEGGRRGRIGLPSRFIKE